MKTNLRSEIELISNEVGKKFLNLREIQAVCALKRNFIPYIGAQPWDPSTTSHGYPSLIFLFSTLDNEFPNQGWNEAVHGLIEKLIEIIEKKGVYNTSLFSGLTGINFSIFHASKNKKNYKNLLNDLNLILLNKINEEYLTPWIKYLDNKEFVPPLFWDFITGISGVLSYLIHFLEDNDIYEISFRFIRILSNWSCSELGYKDQALPAFFTPAELLLRKDHQVRYKPGCIDTGIAHGISGVLSVLAKAAKIESRFKKECENAIKKIANWLIKYVQISFYPDRNVKNIWSSRFVLSSINKKTFKPIDRFYRDGWCYGALGIARSLYLASEAIESEKIRNFSLTVFDSVLERFPNRSGLKCPSFCHGYSGFLTITHNMFLDTKNEKFFQMSSKAAEIIVDNYDSSFPFGFKTLASQLGEADFWIDNPGILDGVVGIILALNFFGSTKKHLWTDLFAV